MGEVIRFDFNKNKRVEKEEETKDAEVFSGVSKSEIEKLSRASLEGLNGDNMNSFIENSFNTKPNLDELNDGDTDRFSENDMLFRKFAHFVISDEHKKFKNLEIKKGPYNQYRDIVGNYTNEQLVNWIVDSNESEWTVKPSFYMAVYEEIKSRLPERYNK